MEVLKASLFPLAYGKRAQGKSCIKEMPTDAQIKAYKELFYGKYGSKKYPNLSIEEILLKE
jgi:hypothetical protein